jgi:hypothetical protein
MSTRSPNPEPANISQDDKAPNRTLNYQNIDLAEKDSSSVKQSVSEAGVFTPNEKTFEEQDSSYNALPRLVRELCDFTDDPSTPVLTWRFYLLSSIFTAVGAWLTEMGWFRTTYVPYSIYFVQVASLYCGRVLAATILEKRIGLGKYTFELNPGPFTVKEHVAIVLAANTGGTRNLGDYVLAPLDVFYDSHESSIQSSFATIIHKLL